MIPMRTIDAKISRRTSRRRVFATGESPSVDLRPAACERAVDYLGDRDRHDDRDDGGDNIPVHLRRQATAGAF